MRRASDGLLRIIIVMSLPRFHNPDPLTVGLSIELTENAARHAVRALRLRQGDGLVLFDGNGGEYVSRIVRIERDRVRAEVMSRDDRECESPINVTLVQALQAGEKMDWTIQKAVELGVARIAPVVSQRSVLRLSGERAKRRVAHWQAVVVSACEQCGRNRVPGVDELEDLPQWLNHPSAEGTLRLMLDPLSQHSLERLTPPEKGSRVELLIGAEGGFSPEEKTLAEQAGFVGVRLGPRILRTETAALAALAAIECLWGDFRATGECVGRSRRN